MERRSRNTLENAEFSRALAAPKPGERWLLVTSAYHMPRSVGLFRKVGFAVEPYPVDWRVGGRGDLAEVHGARCGEGLGRVDTGVREWMGLIAYRATGKIDGLLPGPAANRSRCRNAEAIGLEFAQTGAQRSAADLGVTPCNSNRRRNSSIWPAWWPI